MKWILKSYRSFFLGLFLLFPWAMLAGVVDFRFHHYFWEFLNAWRAPFQSGAFLDFFSVFGAYELLLGFLFVFGLLIKCWTLPSWKEIRQAPWILFAMGLLGVGGLFQILGTQDIFEPVVKSPLDQVLSLYFGPIMMSWIFLSVLPVFKSVRQWMEKSFLAAFLCLGLAALLQFFTGIFPGESVDFMGRLAWPYIDPLNSMKIESANWMAMLFAPMLLWNCLRALPRLQSGKNVSLEMASGLVSALILLLTQSYTAIGIVGILLVLFLFKQMPVAWKKIAVVIGILAAVVSAPFIVQTPKFQILLGHYGQANSLERRAQIYEVTLGSMEDRLLKGIGPGAYQSFFRENQDRFLAEGIPEIELPPHPHNFVLNWWSDLGLAGLLAAALLYLGVGWKLLRYVFGKNTMSSYWLLAAYPLGHGLADSAYGLEEISMLFWIFFSLALSSEMARIVSKKGLLRSIRFPFQRRLS